jgi:hypothetical protein
MEAKIFIPPPPPTKCTVVGGCVSLTKGMGSVVLCRRHSCVVWQRGGPQLGITFVDPLIAKKQLLHVRQLRKNWIRRELSSVAVQTIRYIKKVSQPVAYYHLSKMVPISSKIAKVS